MGASTPEDEGEAHREMDAQRKHDETFQEVQKYVFRMELFLTNVMELAHDEDRVLPCIAALRQNAKLVETELRLYMEQKQEKTNAEQSDGAGADIQAG